MKRETNVKVDCLVAVYKIVSNTVLLDTSWDVYGGVDVVFAPHDPHWALVSRDPEHPGLDKFLRGLGSGE